MANANILCRTKADRTHTLEQRVHGEYIAYYSNDIYTEPLSARKLHRYTHDHIPKQKQQTTQPVMSSPVSVNLSTTKPHSDTSSNDSSNTIYQSGTSKDSSNIMPQPTSSLSFEIITLQYELSSDNSSATTPQSETMSEPPLTKSQNLPSTCTVISSQPSHKLHQCTVCNSSYNQRSSLSHHKKLAGHNTQKGNITCNHEDCTERYV